MVDPEIQNRDKQLASFKVPRHGKRHPKDGERRESDRLQRYRERLSSLKAR